MGVKGPKMEKDVTHRKTMPLAAGKNLQNVTSIIQSQWAYIWAGVDVFPPDG